MKIKKSVQDFMDCQADAFGFSLESETFKAT